MTFDDLPPAAAALLTTLEADPLDQERLIVWATCGFNALAANRARPDLGSHDTFAEVAKRFRGPISQIVQTVLRNYRNNDPACLDDARGRDSA